MKNMVMLVAVRRREKPKIIRHTLAERIRRMIADILMDYLSNTLR
jgi:hypothetical protein